MLFRDLCSGRAHGWPVGGGNLVYQPRQRAEAWRVSGCGAGNSLDSRDDLRELGQTQKRAWILGKSQLLPLFLEILRKIQQAGCQCRRKTILNMLKWGRREEAGQRGGLVWVKTVTHSLGQVFAPSQPQFPISKRVGPFQALRLFRGLILFLSLLFFLLNWTC